MNFEVYGGMSFRDLCKEIVTRSKSKKDQLDTLFTDVRGFITDKSEAIVFLPKLKEFLETGIKNDEQLVKLAAVVQRLQSTQLEASGGDSGGMSDEEKEQLLINAAREKIKEIKKDVDSIIIPTATSAVITTTTTV